MVARSDGAELAARHLLEMAGVGGAPGVVVVEQRVLDALRIDAADAEAHRAADVGEDAADPVVDRCARHVEAHRHVAAADVVADAADRDMLLIGDDAADRLRIAEVPVGAQHAADHAADTHAARHLRLGARIMLAEDFEVHGALPSGWGWGWELRLVVTFGVDWSGCGVPPTGHRVPNAGLFCTSFTLVFAVIGIPDTCHWDSRCVQLPMAARETNTTRLHGGTP